MHKIILVTLALIITKEKAVGAEFMRPLMASVAGRVIGVFAAYRCFVCSNNLMPGLGIITFPLWTWIGYAGGVEVGSQLVNNSKTFSRIWEIFKQNHVIN